MLTLLVPPAMVSLIASFLLVIGIQYTMFLLDGKLASGLGRPRPPIDDDDDFEPDRPD